MLMKTAVVALFVLCVLVMGFQCPPGEGVLVTIDDEAIGLSVVEVENGLEITNTGEIAVIVSVRSLEGEQQFELDVGEVVKVAGITPPIEVWAVVG